MKRRTFTLSSLIAAFPLAWTRIVRGQVPPDRSAECAGRAAKSKGRSLADRPGRGAGSPAADVAQG